MALSEQAYYAAFDLAGYTFPVTTAHGGGHDGGGYASDSGDLTANDVAAQTWFNRAMLQLWNFNHEEAVTCAKHAIAADAGCAMAHWAVAFALGVNYNKPAMTDAEIEEATTHAAAAAHIVGVDPKGCQDADAELPLMNDAYTPLERALVHALCVRYERGGGAQNSTARQARLNRSFVNASRDVYAAHGGASSEACAVYADALMCTRPWKLWEKQTGDGGGVDPETNEIRAVLEKAMSERAPGDRHPGLCHLHVHLMEMSPRPAASLPVACAALRARWPSCGHLLHMATHIDMQVGAYGDAVACNQAAVRADLRWCALRGHATYYHGYLCHNYHMLAWAAGFDAQFAVALDAAEQIVKRTPDGMLREWVDFMEPYMAGAWHVLVRFGRWDDILARALPDADDDTWLVCTATARWARGMARAARGECEAAAEEQALFEAALAAVPATRVVHNVTSRRSLAVGAALLDGELRYRRAVALAPAGGAGRERALDAAYARLREAVALEEALPYDEPWGWTTPTRHALGALLLEQGRARDAEAVYRADLARHPNNVWALRGLASCLARRDQGEAGVAAELAATRAAAAEAGARADVPVVASCFCAKAAMAAAGGKANDGGAGSCCGGGGIEDEPPAKKSRVDES